MAIWQFWLFCSQIFVSLWPELSSHFRIQGGSPKRYGEGAATSGRTEILVSNIGLLPNYYKFYFHAWPLDMSACRLYLHNSVTGQTFNWKLVQRDLREVIWLFVCATGFISLKMFWFFFSIGAIIRLHQEIQSVPYAGFSLTHFFHSKGVQK